MTDYKALVDRLRKPHLQNPTGVDNIFSQAADAVEALVAESETLRREVEFKKARIRGAVSDYEEECARRDRAEAERDEALSHLAESRARFADSEARRVELEAANATLRSEAEAIMRTVRDNGTDFERGQENVSARVLEVLAAVPSTVLGERDQEVAARTLEEFGDWMHELGNEAAGTRAIELAAAIRRGEHA